MNELDIDTETLKQWSMAKKHIESCITKMPAEYKQDDVEALMDYVIAFIERKEYALAIEELTAIGKLNTFSKDYGGALYLAAKAMGLEDLDKANETPYKETHHKETQQAS